MAKIELRGKYAVGRHRFTFVDDADFSWLNSFAWKAKPNCAGIYTYAVRNTVIKGRNVTLRMHREICGLGVDEPLVVDHVNHDTLDNKRANLRVVTAGENNRHRRKRVQISTCQMCGGDFASVVNMFEGRRICKPCERRARHTRYVGKETILLLQCAQCGIGMTGKMKRKRYCSDACRARAKRNPRAPGLVERLGIIYLTPTAKSAAYE